ncbi:MAG: tetratricopeptide repeat protein [Verrucomicrobia bacterium]|nr:tetratricopeptide repeat protein [Verrucomicrobiota bacterium]
MKGSLILSLLGSAACVCTLMAQEPEVRRAIPVIRGEQGSDFDYQNPSWMSHVSPTPAQTPTPTPIPAPTVDPRKFAPEPGFTPFRPSGRVTVSPTPESEWQRVPAEVPAATSVRVATPIPIERPTRAATPVPIATPIPIRRAEPVQRMEPIPTATPAAIPAATPAAAVAVPTPDEDGIIRLSPTAPAADTTADDLNRANAVYARKMYDYAVAEYEKFLIAHPTAVQRDQALFRLGESHRLLGNDDSARDAYQRLVTQFQTGEFVGAGAFRLGEYLFGDRMYEQALKQFQTASEQATSPEVKLSAKYQQARCLEKLKRTDDAVRMYQEVADVTKDNPYRDYARLSLAEVNANAGKKKEALEAFAKLAADPGPSAMRAEAAVKAAALAAEMGDQKRAASLFDAALALPDLGDWKAIAVLGAMRTFYTTGNYQKVTALKDKYLDSLPEDTRAEALLLAANSYRQLGNAQSAQTVYNQLITQYPEAAQAQDARFQKLVSMYQLEDPTLLAEVDSFLQVSKDPKQRAQAQLLKAEALFKKQDYAAAAPLYNQVLAANIDADIKGKAMMKLGWCLGKTGQFAPAEQIYTAYLQQFPKGSSALNAVIQRGLARQELKDYDGALKDFNSIIDNNKDAKERELALQQKALIQGQQQDYKAMAATFKQLLAEYPKTSAAGQANFWIGWAAYENKDYAGAIPSLEAARKLDPQYADRATLRIILAYYYQQNTDALKQALKDNPKVQVPAEINRWLGRKSFEEGDYATAERNLLPVVTEGKTAEPDALIELAEAQIRLGKASAASPHVANYLKVARDPASRARGLIAQGRIALAAKQYDEAQRLDEEALLLQPEGSYNADARMLSGEISLGKGDYDGAARAFLSLAVLYNDPAVTPRALELAAEAYRKAGNTFEAEKAAKELRERFPDFKKSSRLTKE